MMGARKGRGKGDWGGGGWWGQSLSVHCRERLQREIYSPPFPFLGTTMQATVASNVLVHLPRFWWTWICSFGLQFDFSKTLSDFFKNPSFPLFFSFVVRKTVEIGCSHV